MPRLLVEDVFAAAVTSGKCTKRWEGKRYMFHDFADVRDIPDDVLALFGLDQDERERAASNQPARGGWAAAGGTTASAGKTGACHWWRFESHSKRQRGRRRGTTQRHGGGRRAGG